jgi:hypothetical protein
MRIRTHLPNSITKNRSPQMNIAEEKMNDLINTLMYLPGWPEQGTHGPAPEFPLEVTMIVETTRAGDMGEMRHPGTTMLFRWWPDHRIPPESKPV